MYQIYIRELCNYCNMAKAELNRLQLPFEEIAQTKKTREELLARSGLNESVLPSNICTGWYIDWWVRRLFRLYRKYGIENGTS